MPKRQFDITVPFDPVLLALQPDRERAKAEAIRYHAEEYALSYGYKLRHDHPIEQLAEVEAKDKTTGQDVILVATRWVADPHPLLIARATN